MEIICTNLSKKYNSEWIFKGVDLHFLEGQSYAVIGSNGSGKSTLLQCISGMLPASSGIVNFKKEELIHQDDYYKYLSIAAPYLELLEDYTLIEHIKFHINFVPLEPYLSAEDFISYLQLDQSADKAIKYFSSGMKQKLKLGLAILSNRPILLLDEPTSNLDTKGIQWYKEEIEKVKNKKLIIVCSNQEYEYDFCKSTIEMKDLK